MYKDLPEVQPPTRVPKCKPPKAKGIDWYNKYKTATKNNEELKKKNQALKEQIEDYKNQLKQIIKIAAG